MLYSTAAEQEEELKHKIKILGGRQGGKAKGDLEKLYKSLPEGATPETYDKWYEEGGDATFKDWSERQDRKPGEMYEWNTDMKIEDKAKPYSSSSGGSEWNDMSIGDRAEAVGGFLSQTLNTLDMLTGGQDKIIPGSGHTYSSGYNPEMYIGRGVGY